MAIYRCEFKIISRGSGHRACAAAAYRAGEKIMDERYGAAHDYTRKTGVAASFILAPDNAPDWMSNRAELWNAVEAVERRKDAQLCREVLLSLPHELTDDQREALVRQFVRDQFVSKGMVADVNIHKGARADEVLAPKSGKPSGKADVRGRIEEPEKKPHFLDPDYEGPSKEELDRARELEKAIRVHKAREARKRAAERRRLERDKDRDGPER